MEKKSESVSLQTVLSEEEKSRRRKCVLVERRVQGAKKTGAESSKRLGFVKRQEREAGNCF